jgi:beta-lactamase regulating signal transducer with metallopeptidase domain
MPDLFRSDWANALGWSLIHSMWQSLLVLLIVLGILRLIPGTHSRMRYAVSCGGLLLIVLSSIATFLYIMAHTGAPITPVGSAHPHILGHPHSGGEFSVSRYLSFAAVTIQQNMPFIMMAWLIGFIVFAIRLFSALAYTTRLTSSALPLENHWGEYMRDLSRKLGIKKMVSLAQSHVITSPMVIGYFKPVILIPMGMISGLSTEQLETIFLHELAHIKRHDYLINLIQSLVEIAFFFNPVVWILSDLIKKEREFCCDDLVISRHGHASAYAHALVQLEEVRLTRHLVALSLAEDKNQLLNRIRRIMERSVKNYSGNGRLILPALLLVTALACLSWLSISQEQPPQQNTATVAGDTAKPKNKKGSAWYSRKKIITTDKDGQPHEEIVEDFEGDESLRPLMQHGFPGFSQIFPPGFSADSLRPGMHPGVLPDSFPGFDFKDQMQWEELSKIFGDQMGKEFQDFYSFRGMDPSTFMKEFQQSFEWPLDNFDFPADSLQGLQFDADAFRDLKEQMQHFHNLQMDDDRHADLQPGAHADNFDRYEQALRQQLIRDGYLSRNETITSMEWSDDTFKVNGKDIRPADRKKYADLHDQYIGTGKFSGRME